MEDTNPGTETTTPSSFSEAAAAMEASSASAPGSDASAETPAPAATTQAADGQPEPGSESATTDSTPKGEPPQWRWQEIKESLRKKTAEETEAKVRQEYAQRITEHENERRGYEVLTSALNGDARALAMVAQADPGLAARIRGQAQETPSGPEPEPQPDAAIQMADGTTVPVFTPQGQKRWQEWNKQYLESSLKQTFQPLMTLVERQQQSEQREQQTAEAHRWAASVLAPVQRLPHFAEFKPAILAAVNNPPAGFNGSLDELVYDTYTALFTDKANGKDVSARASFVADLHAKTAATTVAPGRTTTALPKRPKDFYEAARLMEDASAR